MGLFHEGIGSESALIRVLLLECGKFAMVVHSVIVLPISAHPIGVLIIPSSLKSTATVLARRLVGCILCRPSKFSSVLGVLAIY